MISRREVVTAGVLGTLSQAAMAAPEDAHSGQENLSVQTSLGQIRGELAQTRGELAQMRNILDDGMRKPSLSFGGIVPIREKLTRYLRSSGKFPDYCEIGTNLFYDVYDWHVKHAQQIQITRISEQRFAIQFMFTQLIVRWEQDQNFVGEPYDRG